MTWVPAPFEHQRTAHNEALVWSHALPWQIDRLHALRREVMRFHDERRMRNVYTHEDSYPFYRMQAETLFTLHAARQLVRALMKFDGDRRLPPGLTNAHLRDLRNALEHWDERKPGDSREALEAQGIDPTGHRWRVDGSGKLADVVDERLLRQWGGDVHAELLTWDPWDGFARAGESR